MPWCSDVRCGAPCVRLGNSLLSMRDLARQVATQQGAARCAERNSAAFHLQGRIRDAQHRAGQSVPRTPHRAANARDECQTSRARQNAT